MAPIERCPAKNSGPFPEDRFMLAQNGPSGELTAGFASYCAPLGASPQKRHAPVSAGSKHGTQSSPGGHTFCGRPEGFTPGIVHAGMQRPSAPPADVQDAGICPFAIDRATHTSPDVVHVS